MSEGTVAAIWRYPVKSMLGEMLEVAEIDSRGVGSDRVYAVVDPAENRVGSAKIPHKWRQLYEFRAAGTRGESGVRVTFPDGSELAADDPAIEARLSEALGREVQFVTEKPEGLGLEAVKPGMDAIALEETIDFPLINPFFDFAALHVVTTSTLARFRELYPAGDFDARRFRPNIVLDTGVEGGFVEQTWTGRDVMIGDAVRVRVIMPTHRCAATTLAHHGLPDDNEILRTANKHNGGNVGVYAAVVETGVIRRGDVARLV